MVKSTRRRSRRRSRSRSPSSARSIHSKRRHLMEGTAASGSSKAGSLHKSDLKQNAEGVYVSKRRSANAKRHLVPAGSPWLDALKKAKMELYGTTKGFHLIKGELNRVAHEYYEGKRKVKSHRRRRSSHSRSHSKKRKSHRRRRSHSRRSRGRSHRKHSSY